MTNPQQLPVDIPSLGHTLTWEFHIITDCANQGRASRRTLSCFTYKPVKILIVSNPNNQLYITGNVRRCFPSYKDKEKRRTQNDSRIRNNRKHGCTNEHINDCWDIISGIIYRFHFVRYLDICCISLTSSFAVRIYAKSEPEM